MKRLGSFLVLIMTFVSLLALPANADSFSVSQEIHIRGIVPPMRFIVVDVHGNVLEVTSNTPKNINPVVRLNSISHGATLPLTPGLLAQYKAKTRGHDMHSLDLSFPPSSSTIGRQNNPTLLTMLAHSSLLRLPFRL